MSWPVVVVTLGASAIAVVGTIAATLLQHRFASSDRRAAAETAERERAARILGSVETLLVDAHPMRLGLSASEATFETLREFRARWEPLRDELATLAALTRDADAGLAIQRLSVAVANALTSAGWFVRDLLGGGDTDVKVAQADHQMAVELLELVRATVRGEVDGDVRRRVAEIERDADAERNPRPS